MSIREDGYRLALSLVEGAKEGIASWSFLLRHLKKRSLKGVKRFVTDARMELTESLAEYYPQARW